MEHSCSFYFSCNLCFSEFTLLWGLPSRTHPWAVIWLLYNIFLSQRRNHLRSLAREEVKLTYAALNIQMNDLSSYRQQSRAAHRRPHLFFFDNDKHVESTMPLVIWMQEFRNWASNGWQSVTLIQGSKTNLTEKHTDFCIEQFVNFSTSLLCLGMIEI